MSFQDAALGAPSTSAPSSEFAVMAQSVTRNIFQMNTQVATYRRQTDVLGTDADTKSHREQMRQVRELVQSLAKEANAQLKRLPTEGAGANKPQADKLARDLQRVLGDFQKLLRDSRAAETRYAARPDRAAAAPPSLYGRGGEGPDEEEALLAQQRRQQAELQEQQQVNTMLDYNTAVIEERDQGIREIQRDIGEVNEIFKDLAVLVHEQDSMIDTIESNIVQTHVRTEQGASELKQASKSQKGMKTKLCWILTFVVIGAIMLAVVFLTEKH